MTRKRILIVDDEDSIRFGMSAFLEGSGYSVVAAEGCAQACAAFAATPPDAAVIDYRLEDGTAMDLLRSFRAIDPDVPLLIMTAYGTADRAMQALQEGAAQFLNKPIDMPALLHILQRLISARYAEQQSAP